MDRPADPLWVFECDKTLGISFQSSLFYIVGGHTNRQIPAMTHKSSILTMLLVFAMSACAPQAEDTAAGSADHTSPEWKITAYSSAASPQLAADATVVDQDGTVLREGTNGWICMSGSPDPEPETGWESAAQAQPICADPVGMEWMQAYMSGETPAVSRDAYLYMLQGDQGTDTSVPGITAQENASAPENWVVSGPHLMLMPKDPATLEGYTTDPSTGEPFLMWPGSPYAHLMIPVE